MKKIPIMLSTLTLAMAGASLRAPAAALGEVVAEPSLNRELFMSARLAAEKVNAPLKTNYFDEQVWIDAIIPRTGNLIVDIHVMDEKQAVRRIAVATASYDRVSMTQADKDWSNWDGAALPDWTLRGRILNLDSAQKDFHRLVSVDYRDRNYDLVENNRQDVVYFYAELGGWDESEPEVIRWKMDYRTCSKNVNFPAVGSAVCGKNIDTETGEMTYLHQGEKNPELSFATWADEYKSILQVDIDRLDQNIQELERAEIIKVDTAIANYESEAQELRTRIYEAADSEELDAEITALEDRLSNLRKKHFPEVTPDGTTGDEDDEKNPDKEEDNETGEDFETDDDSGTDDDPGAGGDDDDKSDNGTGNQDKDKGDTGNINTKPTTGTSGTEATTPDKRPDSGANKPQNQETNGTMNRAEVTVNNTSSEETNDNIAVDGNKTTTSEAVEIPNLGGGEEVNLWPWILIIFSITGVSGWWLWRAFGRKTKRK